MSFIDPPETSPVVAAFGALAEGAPLQRHRFVHDVDEADCALFVDLHLSPDLHLRSLLSHPVVQGQPNKTLVYDERDLPWGALPGVYVSMPAPYFDSARQRAFGYYTQTVGTVTESTIQPDLLFSFIGTPGGRASKGCRVRKAILAIEHPRAVIEDSTGFVFYDDQGDLPRHLECQRRFGEIMDRSKFVLCPRGVGTSSIRLYETLRAGRVPVILADDWVAPVGPDWRACSVSVRESDVKRVPELLAAIEHRWPAMSASAREAYRQWFAPEVALDHLFDLCEELIYTKPVQVMPWRDPSYRAMRMRLVEDSCRRMVGGLLRAVKVRP